MRILTEHPDHEAEALSLTRVERASRFIRTVGAVWALAILAVEVISFPRFLIEWYGGAPLALSAGAMAFLWASFALWAGGFRVGYKMIRPHTVTLAQTPGEFWRYVIIALAAGVILVWLGVTRLTRP